MVYKVYGENHMSILGDRIKHRRVELKMTQDDLAELLDTDQKQISKYENNKQTPSAEVLAKISVCLKTTTDWLLGLTNIVDKPLRDERDLTQREKDIINAYRNSDFRSLMQYISMDDDKKVATV
jgi:transcriptional regulator with XRE-family HTH domain